MEYEIVELYFNDECSWDGSIDIEWWQFSQLLVLMHDVDKGQ